MLKLGAGEADAVSVQWSYGFCAAFRE